MTDTLATSPSAVQRATPALIAGLSRAPASARAAMLAALNLKEGGLVIELPCGTRLQFGDHASPMQAEMAIRDYALMARLLRDGDIGFADGYVAGEWDTPDLSAVLTVFSSNLDRVMRLVRGNPMTRMLNLVANLSKENTKEQAKKNIHAHYDLGNRFYEAWLDRTMTYSAALYEQPGQSLGDAQLAKYRALASAIALKPGDRVLEIGCGWGGFAEVAARDFGAKVVGLTISQEQHAYASARMQREGLNELVEIRMQDYRDVEGSFNKVASIEMFEAVGERYWAQYFGKIADVLEPGGQAGLQIITIDERLFPKYRTRVDFIQRYIFPGGMLPSLPRLREEVARAGLAMGEARGFASGYAETLAEWGRRFRAAWADVAPLGFDERFRRLWQFYLSYCEAGFRTGRTDVVQVALAKR